MNILTYRHWGLVFSFVSAAVLATVYISQYGFDFHPCHLCLIQRIPFYIAFVLSILLTIFAERKFARLLLGLLALVFMASMALAIFHVGVEYKWWTYDSGCSSGNIFKRGASTADILKALKAASVVKCDERVPFLFGMTMAFYNALASALFAVTALFAAWKKS